MPLSKTTHAEATEIQRATWRRMTPEERVALGVELSRRAREVARDNGRTIRRVSSLAKRKRG